MCIEKVKIWLLLYQKTAGQLNESMGSRVRKKLSYLILAKKYSSIVYSSFLQLRYFTNRLKLYYQYITIHQFRSDGKENSQELRVEQHLLHTRPLAENKTARKGPAAFEFLIDLRIYFFFLTWYIALIKMQKVWFLEDLLCFRKLAFMLKFDIG